MNGSDASIAEWIVAAGAWINMARLGYGKDHTRSKRQEVETPHSVRHLGVRVALPSTHHGVKVGIPNASQAISTRSRYYDSCIC